MSASSVDERRVCEWCTGEFEVTAPHAKFCKRSCRQSAFRLRKRGGSQHRTDRPLRFAYADPPFPGMAARHYSDEPTYAGEVDHASLLQKLRGYDGWALSTSERALREILPMCPPAARLCPWGKPIGVPEATYGLHNTWEALIVFPGRHLRPGKPDWLRAMPARGGGTLMGRKPLAFCAYLFEALGMVPGDTLDDLFPGTGIVSRAWSYLSLTPAERVAESSGRRVVVDLNDASPQAADTRRSSSNDARNTRPRNSAEGDASRTSRATREGRAGPC